VDLPAVPWHWNKATQVAVPPAVSCFKNFEYSHGGVSLQECVTSILIVSGGHAVRSEGSVKVTGVKWLGLRCKAMVETKLSDLRADLRSKVADADSSVIEAPTPIDADGSVSMLVPDDDRMGEAAFLVVLIDGEPVAKEQVTIGG
jgi:hypothetical protein